MASKLNACHKILSSDYTEKLKYLLVDYQEICWCLTVLLIIYLLSKYVIVSFYSQSLCSVKKKKKTITNKSDFIYSFRKLIFFFYLSHKNKPKYMVCICKFENQLSIQGASKLFRKRAKLVSFFLNCWLSNIYLQVKYFFDLRNF